MPGPTVPPLKSICYGPDGQLTGLDEEGAVWFYYPARPAKGQFAVWAKATTRRMRSQEERNG